MQHEVLAVLALKRVDDKKDAGPDAGSSPDAGTSSDAGTVRTDNPSLTARLDGVTVEPLRVVLDPELSCDPGSAVFHCPEETGFRLGPHSTAQAT